MKEKKPKSKWLVAALAFGAGIITVAGMGMAVTLTDQPAFCGSCHAMDEAVWTHSQSVHAALTCNDCHTPHSLPAKLPYKAQIGLHDIYINVLGQVPDSIHARGDMKEVVQTNCLRCHSSTVQNITMDTKPYCTDCHRSVPHNTKLPLDERRAADA